MRLFILGLLVICAKASPQYVKTAGVKGGYSGRGYQYHGGENLVSNYNSTQHGYGNYIMRTNLTEPVNYEKGVCYIEVPTASLVRDPTHVPAGNGSRPDLSRIRSCCRGYVRNIHNYKICDPVCTHECVNGLCSAPETCTCFPDHVKNLAGFCVATCPIGCQNGQCSGGECICKDGYRLDSESKFCVPYCREQCGGLGGGNCTAPNICECRNGYRSTPEGACKPACDRCKDGECVGPNDCRCSAGYVKNQYGDCVPQCSTPCSPPSRCIAPNVCENPSNPSTTTKPSPYGQQPTHNQNTQNPTRVPYGQQPQYPGHQQPNYPGNQQPNYPGGQSYYPGYPQSNYPGNQPSGYPGNQPSSYPGNQPPYYPGSPQSNSSGSPQSNSSGSQQYYPGSQQYYPGSQQYFPGSQQHYPGSQQYYPGNQPSNYTNRPGYQPSNYPGNQPNHTSNQPSNYPGQRPSNYPDGQPIYTYIPSNQPSLYPDSQHLSPDQRPNLDNQSPNSSQPNAGVYYPNSQYYPGSQHYPDQQRPNYPNNQQPSQPQNNAEPYYPNSQYYPGSQHNQHNYPYGQINYQNQPNQPHYPGSIYPSQGSEYQHIYQNSQSSAVEMLCSQTCVNGTCVGRDVCACNSGYEPIASDNSRCQPHCIGCSNGVCVSPYVCECNPGYFKDFSVKGRSTCVRRIRRSVDTSAPVNVADLLVFEIPDDID